MSTWSKSVILLLCGLMLLTVSLAVLNTLTPLWLAHDRLPTWQIGVVSSAYYTGNLVGTLLAGRLIERYGFNRSYYLATALFCIAALALIISTGFWSWSFWRFIAGTGCALIWVIVESALMSSGTIRNRGQLLAAYMVIYYGATLTGQLLVSSVSTQLLHVIPWVSALSIASVLPVLFVRIVPQKGDEKVAPHRIWPMLSLRNARPGIHGCIVSGIILGSLYGLMPLYLSRQEMIDARVGYWMALLISAGMIGQWPAGRLADRFGRLLVLRVQVFVVMIGAIAMLSQVSMGAALFMLGCAGFTLYPLAMSWACETVKPYELIAMNQALLLSYTAGSLVGPFVIAMLMQNYSDRLLFVVIAAVSLLYLIMLLRKSDIHATPIAQASIPGVKRQ
ncbi:MFS transporter [Enterobacteriaceae bacterium LUAb1]